MSEDAYFEVRTEGQEEVFRPLPGSHSGWGNKLLRGLAVTGLLARSSEAAAKSAALGPRFRPARFNADLFRPAPAADCRVRSKVVRQGRRICVVDSVLMQDGVVVARATTLWLHEQESPRAAVWSPDRPLPPPPTLRPAPGDRRIYYVEGAGWMHVEEVPDSKARRGTWHLPVPIVQGEEPTGFVAGACVADVINVVSNWGNTGLQHINTDVTLALSRVPDPDGMGLLALDRHEDRGIAIGTAALFDRYGRCGTVTTVALANAAKAVDPRTKTPLAAARENEASDVAVER